MSTQIHYLNPPPIFVNREDTRRHAKKIIQKTPNKNFLEVRYQRNLFIKRFLAAGGKIDSEFRTI